MEADYIIVGAGSAGCALAFRLSESGKHSVLIIEHGGSDAGPLINMPGALSYPMSMSRYDWGFRSEPELNLNGRCMATPRGKVIGGSSSINGMIYVRGHSKDFDYWAESGAKSWAYKDVLPYFKKMENWSSGGHGGDSSWRGNNGPLHVTRGQRANPLVKAFISAGKEAGYHQVGDYNGYQQEGFGPYDMNVYKGQRWSAAKAYLRPALKRANCRIIRALALKIKINNGCAAGVEVFHNGVEKLLKANKEVIIAASSINSPKLLMLSGIGPASHLREHGIDVVVDRPGVGKNLQDHLEVYMQMAASKPVSLFKYWNFWGKAYVGARWLLTKTGPGSTNQFESAAFIRSDKGIEYPDVQYHFLPIAVRYDGKASSEGHGFQAHVGPMRSPSRGEITLKSKDPLDPPKIQFNYMSTEQDWKDFRKCIRLTREIFSQDAFKPYLKHEIQPGAHVNSDDEIDDFIKNEAESAYHPCGTCKMGSETDKNSVVNWETKVIGVKNLRVADSSIFPRITNGNLNAPSIMTGEKAADHILGKSLLSASNSETWINPNWKISQR